MLEPTGRERRLKPRFSAELRCTLRLPAEDRGVLFPNEQIVCRTRDLSENGIGLIAPSIYLGYTCVVDEGRSIELFLELPGGATVKLKAASAHYLRLGRETAETSYLIGLRIIELAGEDLEWFSAYLSELEKSERAGSSIDESPGSPD